MKIKGSSLQEDKAILSAYVHSNNTVAKYTREKWIELQGKTDSTIIVGLQHPSNDYENQQEEIQESHRAELNSALKQPDITENCGLLHQIAEYTSFSS